MHINLARKWRSRHFDEIVGQSLVVRLVKNSLFRNTLAPAYLLAGTRGCGKTSIARIFAAALNCHALALFQKNPQQQIPCLTCPSCLAMQAGTHPDFIEIDAASHTGVDNVRHIVEAASFVPVLGGKKIYLIDEAHMLSKAAFNAFLKILEEPPQSVVFMLATTDVHKIIDTVASRCFHLFFEPIAPSLIATHLAVICTREELVYEEEALLAIAYESEGSLRDALNMLERLRIGYDTITKQGVLELLGTVDDERLCHLLACALTQSSSELLRCYEELGCKAQNSLTLWKKVVSLLHSCLLRHHGIHSEQVYMTEELKERAATCSYEKLLACLELCYTYEPLLTKTTVPSLVFETLLLKLAELDVSSPTVLKKSVNEHKNQPVFSAVTKPTQQSEQGSSSVSQSPKKTVVKKAEEPSVAPVQEETSVTTTTSSATPWAPCLRAIETLKDPLVVSIFRQAKEPCYDAQVHTITLTFPEEILFFKDMFENTKKTWLPVLCRFYGEDLKVISLFTGPSAKEQVKTVPIERAQSPISAAAKAPKTESEVASVRNNPEKWQKSTMIMDLFPGTLTSSDKEQL